jgi:hypothetical protein
MDKTTDVNDVTQLAVFIQDSDSKLIIEEVLELIPTHGTTTGKDFVCEV